MGNRAILDLFTLLEVPSADIMCTGSCSKFIAVPLYVLALVSVICNIMLFFPDFKTSYASEDSKGEEQQITPEVKYMGGLIGGGLMVSTSLGRHSSHRRCRLSLMCLVVVLFVGSGPSHPHPPDQC